MKANWLDVLKTRLRCQHSSHKSYVWFQYIGYGLEPCISYCHCKITHNTAANYFYGSATQSQLASLQLVLVIPFKFYTRPLKWNQAEYGQYVWTTAHCFCWYGQKAHPLSNPAGSWPCTLNFEEMILIGISLQQALRTERPRGTKIRKAQNSKREYRFGKIKTIYLTGCINFTKSNPC